MRKNLCDNNIMHTDGSLNRKYFNVKKGQYWSNLETETLINSVLKLGPNKYKEIKEAFFKNWTETEIKLRICRLFRLYDLSVYEDKKFNSYDEILEEAKKNKEEGK